MARMTIRATYALDAPTDQRIKQLARTWGVSQAEVIRRSVHAAAEAASDTLSPADVVSRYSAGAVARDKKETRRVIQSLRDLRHADDDHRLAGTA